MHEICKSYILCYEYFKLYSELPIFLGIILLSHSARVCMLRTSGETRRVLRACKLMIIMTDAFTS